jgi:hypothetical protein
MAPFTHRGPVFLERRAPSKAREESILKLVSDECAGIDCRQDRSATVGYGRECTSIVVAIDKHWRWQRRRHGRYRSSHLLKVIFARPMTCSACSNRLWASFGARNVAQVASDCIDSRQSVIYREVLRKSAKVTHSVLLDSQTASL